MTYNDLRFGFMKREVHVPSYEKYFGSGLDFGSWTPILLAELSMEHIVILSVHSWTEASMMGVEYFLDGKDPTPAGRELARLMATDYRLAVITRVCDSVEYSSWANAEKDDRIIKELNQSRAYGELVDAWNNLGELSLAESTYFRKTRFRARDKAIKSWKDYKHEMTLSQDSYQYGDLYRVMAKRYPYPRGLENVVSRYKPDLYFVVTPSDALCAHSKYCACHFWFTGNHPVTKGKQYKVWGVGVIEKTQQFLAEMGKDFVWSEADGLMSRVDQCPPEICGPFSTGTSESGSLTTPYTMTSLNAVAEENLAIEKASELARGSQGLNQLWSMFLSSSRYAGTILQRASLKLTFTRIDCRHEGCSCNCMAAGAEGFLYQCPMADGLFMTLRKVVEVAYVYYSLRCAITSRLNHETGEMYHGKFFTDDKFVDWFPVKDLSEQILNVFMCMEDMPLELIMLVVEGLRKCRYDGNVVRHAEKLQTVDRYKLSMPYVTQYVDLTNCPEPRNVRLTLFQGIEGSMNTPCTEPVGKSRYRPHLPAIVRVSNFAYSYVRLTEGCPSRFVSLGSPLEDIILHYDSDRNGNVLLIVPPVVGCVSPWLTFYRNDGYFIAYGLRHGLPFGLPGDIVFGEEGVFKPKPTPSNGYVDIGPPIVSVWRIPEFDSRGETPGTGPSSFDLLPDTLLALNGPGRAAQVLRRMQLISGLHSTPVSEEMSIAIPSGTYYGGVSDTFHRASEAANNRRR